MPDYEVPLFISLSASLRRTFR